VRLLAAAQSQEYAHGFWSLGMRTRGSTYADVQRAFDEGGILRTHMLRTTWHFVAADDIRWMLEATSSRVHAKFGNHIRGLGLDERVQRDTGDLVLTMFQGEKHLTRKEIGAERQQQIVDITGDRLAYIVMSAELRGLICSGPMRGAPHTYAVFEERVPTGLTYEGDAARSELAFRFFAGHGPATCCRYPQLNFPTAPGHPHPPDMVLFVGSVIVGERNVGTWRRTLSGTTLVIETDLAPGLDEEAHTPVADAVNRLRQFLGHSAQ
jgi:Winged helix DNA-binding domain